MRRPVPVVLAIGGSDPSGGAGIQADIQALAAHGAHPAAVPTALTVQDTRGVRRVHPVHPQLLHDQVRLVVEDLRPEAVKLGMLCDTARVEAVDAALRGWCGALVIDPVLGASSGAPLLDAAGLEALLERLAPRATVLTPNLVEWQVLERRLPPGPAVLVKGGHGDGPELEDRLTWSGRRYRWRHPRLETASTHGTGCLLASALAARLARGESLPEAAGGAIAWLQDRLRRATGLRLGHGPHHPVVPAPG